MKKTLLSVTAALAVIGSACAAPSVDAQRRICESKPDKYVWVEKDEFCVPNNPCKSDSPKIRMAYCNRVFMDIQLGRRDFYEELVDVYLKNFLGVTGKSYGKTTTLLGDDYLGYKLSDGGYVVFEFDDLSDITKSDRRLSAVYGACLAYGGHSSFFEAPAGVGQEVTEVVKPSYTCQNITYGTCADIAELATKVLGEPMRVDAEGSVSGTSSSFCRIGLVE